MDAQRHILSIMVITYNEARHVARLQRSVDALRKPDGVQVETILVDGGSTDGTADAAREAGFTVVDVMPGANIPVCRNRAAQLASGDWFAYVDGDCELASDWLEVASSFLREYRRVLLGWPARPPEPMNPLQAAWNFHWLNKNPHMIEVLGRQIVQHEGFRLATTRNMVLHRTVLEAVQGFNESLPTGEDTDFAFRVYMEKIPAFGVPDLRVIHHGEPVTLGQFYKQQLWHANRRSYEHIRRLSGGRVGGNAPRFTWAFLFALLAALASVPIAWFTGRLGWIALLLPWLAVIGLPATFISLKGRTLRHFPMLCLLYATYGWARMIDLIGLSPHKPSWKS